MVMMVKRGETWTTEQRANYECGIAERKRKCRHCGLQSTDVSLYVRKAGSLFGVTNLCRRCHARRTKERRAELRSRISAMIKIHTLRREHPSTIHTRGVFFRPGEKKSFTLGRSEALRYKWETVEAEMAKCDLICANCHRIRTTKRRSQSKA